MAFSVKYFPTCQVNTQKVLQNLHKKIHKNVHYSVKICVIYSDSVVFYCRDYKNFESPQLLIYQFIAHLKVSTP